MYLRDRDSADINYSNINHSNLASTSSSSNTTQNCNTTAAIGVVIPTTPGNTILNSSIGESASTATAIFTKRSSADYVQQYQLLSQLQQQLHDSQHLLPSSSQTSQKQNRAQEQIQFQSQPFNQYVLPQSLLDLASSITTGDSNDVTGLQRFNCIQYLLSLTTKPSSEPLSHINTNKVSLF